MIQQLRPLVPSPSEPTDAARIPTVPARDLHMQTSANTDFMYDARNGIHAGLTAILAWIAFRLAMPDDTFATTSSFAYMARLAPENTWALLFWAVANLGIIGLATTNKVIRLASVLVVATAHGVLAGCLLMSDGSIWSGTFGIIACMGYYLAYRRARAGI